MTHFNACHVGDSVVGPRLTREWNAKIAGTLSMERVNHGKSDCSSNKREVFSDHGGSPKSGVVAAKPKVTRMLRQIQMWVSGQGE
jgi:hypothetical protein